MTGSVRWVTVLKVIEVRIIVTVIARRSPRSSRRTSSDATDESAMMKSGTTTS